ncbi:hypothetical protein RSAG8_02586, partial [Rhizoctonia solani AG-8 WAC10335]
MATERQIRDDPSILMKLVTPGDIVLPEGEENVLITSALPYCNNVPHLGNIIGSTLSADVFARYNRARNRRTLYICGTDEYGTATETQALKEKITPRELCDRYSALHRETYDWFELSFDHFGRTSIPEQTQVCQEAYTNLSNNGMLQMQTKAQTYCEGCSKFLADRFVEGTCPHCGYEDARGDQCDGCTKTLDPVELINPRCLVDRSHKIITRDTAHMYVRLDLVQPRLEEWIKNSWKVGRWSPNSVINSEGEIVDSRLKGGLRPSPITRDLTWGVPVPKTSDKDSALMEGKVLYVWFDAPFGYPSITAAYTKEWKRWWFNPNNVRLFQFMGKDNVYFHTVLWPGILFADGREWTRLHHLSTTEYLKESGKFSKSRGVGVFGPGAKETGIPPAVWRYYLLASRPETSDSMFSWADFIAGNNNVLLKNFGNFVNRVIKFLTDQFNGVIPESGDAPGPLPPNEDEADPTFVSEINDLLTEYLDSMDRALKEKITPRELCDRYSALHRETYDWFELSFDHFGRTSIPEQTQVCQEAYTNLSNNGMLQMQTKAQTYCEGCSKFLADRFVEGTCPHCGYEDARGDQCDGCTKTLDPVELINPRCLVDRSHKIITRDTAHMYVRLDLVQPRLEEWIKNSWKFDAPFGYPSITAAYTKEWKRWWFNPDNVRLFQFMGKDNVYFHTVLWPGILFADGREWTRLHHLSTTEYLNYESGKFSKSRGVGVFGPGAKETGIPPAVWRYYLLASRPETSDSMFSWADFIAGNNNVLLKNFGNLVNRVIKFLTDKFNGVIPESGDAPGPLPPNEDEADPTFVSEINDLLTEYLDSMDRVKLRHSLNLVMSISARGNAYLQRCNLTKALLEKDPKRCAQVLSRALNLIYTLSALIHPFMPSTSDAILRQLNAPARVIPSVLSTDILPGHKLGAPELLFAPIKETKADEWRNKFGGAQKAAAKAAKANAPPVPKTPEIVELEVKVKAQGERVRAIKEGKAQEGETLETALAELLALKASLKDAEEQAIKSQLEAVGAQPAAQA